MPGEGTRPTSAQNRLLVGPATSPGVPVRVQSNNGWAAYSFLANRQRVGRIGFPNSGVGRMTTTKPYDFLNRLGSIASSGPALQPVSFAYPYNNANQRVRATLADGSFWRYEYD